MSKGVTLKSFLDLIVETTSNTGTFIGEAGGKIPEGIIPQAEQRRL
ncbi:hypothetical protein [Pelotalea chapellei]|uniref:Uncharacterized protein n=1 Tax=Pelotalea chapellei TaxID=44671 RepID=A0ABS5U5X1_9BACT|nr:hypothetical protein [Pelotalea chapellei]MBT1071066.1 hypothetical protein [Pelotalea chapellei]